MDISSLNREELTLLGTGGCTMLALHFTSQLVSQHLYYWKNPKEQRAIMIIVLLAPVYTIYSFVGVLDLKGGKLFLMLMGFIKESYKALVVAKFLDLLYSYLNMDISQNTVPDEVKGREIRHVFPINLFQARKTYLNQQSLKLLKYQSWQFVVTRPACSLVMIGLQLLGMYPSWVSWTFTVILNISCCMAMYSLIVFYRVFAKELKPHKPLAKFSTVIAIIFFTFWQEVLIDILVESGVIKSHHCWADVPDVGEAIKYILICVEMVLFSVFQQYAFHFEPYSGNVQTMLQKGQKKE